MRDQWVDIYLLDGRKIRAPVPRGSHQTPEVLERALQEGMVREMQKRLGGGGPAEKSRSKRAVTSQDANTTKLANALRYLWREWELLAANPDLRVRDDPNKFTFLDAGATEPREVRRPRLPPGFEYRLFTQTLPDGRTRNYVDIVNTEEEARHKEQLAEAQRVLDVEFADPRTGMHATPTHYHILEETGADAEGRPKGRAVAHERPPLPRGYRYATKKKENAEPGDAIQTLIHIERDADEQEHSTAASHISAKRLFTENIQLNQPPKKQPKTQSVVPSESVQHTPGATRAVIEERELVASDAETAAAALPREEAIVAQEPREPLAQAAPASEARVANVEESVDLSAGVDGAPPPDRVHAKQPMETSGEPAAEEVVPPDAPVSEASVAAGMESAEALDLVRRTRFIYDRALNRFRLETDAERVRFVAVSPQLGFTLGYERGDKITHEEWAVYPPDMRGGISNIAIYCSIADNVILGDRMTSLLRVIAVTGKPGDILEKTYDAPIFSRISDREVSDIEIEIRTMEGRLIPFEYGVAVVTLQFRKMLYY